MFDSYTEGLYSSHGIEHLMGNKPVVNTKLVWILVVTLLGAFEETKTYSLLRLPLSKPQR